MVNSVGASNYNMLVSLVSPRTPAELTNEYFRTALCPKKNIMVSQHHFLSTYHTETQTIIDYIATLRRDIIDCEFISPGECHLSTTDTFLCAQSVRGILDHSICKQILESELHAFDEIALKASKIDSHGLSKKSTTLTSAHKEVNKVFKYQNTNVMMATPRTGIVLPLDLGSNLKNAQSTMQNQL
jgi:hypothetical protein